MVQRKGRRGASQRFSTERTGRERYSLAHAGGLGGHAGNAHQARRGGREREQQAGVISGHSFAFCSPINITLAKLLVKRRGNSVNMCIHSYVKCILLMKAEP